MKILVCGGRNFKDRVTVFTALDFYANGAERIIHGNAPGADRLAEEWAEGRGIWCVAYSADWQKHGKAAGPLRNQMMLDMERPSLVVAFPGGRGTADMIARARKAGVTVIQPLPSPPSDHQSDASAETVSNEVDGPQSSPEQIGRH